MRPNVTFMQERVCNCDYGKRDEQSVHFNSFLQVSCFFERKCRSTRAK